MLSANAFSNVRYVCSYSRRHYREYVRSCSSCRSSIIDERVCHDMWILSESSSSCYVLKNDSSRSGILIHVQNVHSRSHISQIANVVRSSTYSNLLIYSGVSVEIEISSLESQIPERIRHALLEYYVFVKGIGFFKNVLNVFVSRFSGIIYRERGSVYEYSVICVIDSSGRPYSNGFRRCRKSSVRIVFVNSSQRVVVVTGVRVRYFYERGSVGSSGRSRWQHGIVFNRLSVSFRRRYQGVPVFSFHCQIPPIIFSLLTWSYVGIRQYANPRRVIVVDRVVRLVLNGIVPTSFPNDSFSRVSFRTARYMERKVRSRRSSSIHYLSGSVGSDYCRLVHVNGSGRSRFSLVSRDSRFSLRSYWSLSSYAERTVRSDVSYVLRILQRPFYFGKKVRGRIVLGFYRKMRSTVFRSADVHVIRSIRYQPLSFDVKAGVHVGKYPVGRSYEKIPSFDYDVVVSFPVNESLVESNLRKVVHKIDRTCEAYLSSSFMRYRIGPVVSIHEYGISRTPVVECEFFFCLRRVSRIHNNESHVRFGIHVQGEFYFSDVRRYYRKRQLRLVIAYQI